MKPRPLSPHLQIYKPQLTSVLSILHRLTGLYLSLGLIVLVGWIIAIKTGPDAFAFVKGLSASWLGLLMLFGWTFSLVYHFCSGIRHLFWDVGCGFSLKNTYLSGWAVVIISIVLTIALWVIPFMMEDFIYGPMA